MIEDTFALRHAIPIVLMLAIYGTALRALVVIESRPPTQQTALLRTIDAVLEARAAE